jgi:ankyrin repeat protein
LADLKAGKTSAEGFDANQTRHDGETGLFVHVREQNKGMILHFLNHDEIDPNKPNAMNYDDRGKEKKPPHRGNTPLIHATKMGYFDIVKVLVTHEKSKDKININQIDKNGCTALRVACKAASKDQFYPNVIHFLLNQQKMDVNQGDACGCTPLMYVCQGIEATAEKAEETRWPKELSGVLQQLLNHPDINVNKPTKRGWTPLMMASYHGFSFVVTRLVERPDTDINFAQPETDCERISGTTALFTAVEHARLEVVKLLLTRPELHLTKSRIRKKKSGALEISTPLNLALSHATSEKKKHAQVRPVYEEIVKLLTAAKNAKIIQIS